MKYEDCIDFLNAMKEDLIVGFEADKIVANMLDEIINFLNQEKEKSKKCIKIEKIENKIQELKRNKEMWLINLLTIKILEDLLKED